MVRFSQAVNRVVTSPDRGNAHTPGQTAQLAPANVATRSRQQIGTQRQVAPSAHFPDTASDVSVLDVHDVLRYKGLAFSVIDAVLGAGRLKRAECGAFLRHR